MLQERRDSGHQLRSHFPRPSLGPDHAKILALRERRAVRQHELNVVAPRPRRIAPRARQRMVGCRNGDQLDAADADALEAGDLPIERSAVPSRLRLVLT